MRGFWAKLCAFFVTPDPWEQVDEGYSAWYEGKKENENPYEEGSIYHMDWEYGWTEAEDENMPADNYTANHS